MVPGKSLEETHLGDPGNLKCSVWYRSVKEGRRPKKQLGWLIYRIRLDP